MSNGKEIKRISSKSLSEKKLLELAEMCDITAISSEHSFHIPNEKFKELVKKCKSLDGVRDYVRNLEGRSYEFEALGDKIREEANGYGENVPDDNFVFHGALIDKELGKSVFVSNLAKVGTDGLTELMFRNCQMSPRFRDVIVETYMLCKKAGIDKGDYKPKI